MHSFLVALSFLTVFPIRFRKMPSAEAVAASRFWYPVVGLLLGAALGGWTALLAGWERSSLIAAFLVVLAWVAATGALHFDGLCDLCDGLFGGNTPEDRLRIMSDPHVGTFGLAGGVLLLMGKLAAVNEILTGSRQEGPYLIAGSIVVARCLALCMAAFCRYARPQGTGQVLVTAARRWEAVLYVVIAVAATLAAYRKGDVAGAAAALLAPCLAVLVLCWICTRRLHGITGDCLGAAIEIAELVFLLTAGARLG
jgi:adenosylcobinamide-GDP ribazoletransferase